MKVAFYDENDFIIETREMKRAPSVGKTIIINAKTYMPWYVELCRTNGIEYANVRLEIV